MNLSPPQGLTWWTIPIRTSVRFYRCSIKCSESYKPGLASQIGWVYLQ